MTLFRWRGTDSRGQQKFGSSEWPDLAIEVETRFKSGWRSLIVCGGEGPVPPRAIGTDHLVARICRLPDTCKRTWWAEADPETELMAREDRKTEL